MTHNATRKAGFGRRELLKAAGVGAMAIVGGGLIPTTAKATPESVAKFMAKASGTSTPKSGKVKIKLPEIAENGNTVPLTVSVDSPMTQDNYVKSIHIGAEGNPNPQIVSLNLTPSSGKAMVSTRIRLAKTQKVVATAVMSDGSVYQSKKKVKVTIGGCGG